MTGTASLGTHLGAWGVGAGRKVSLQQNNHTSITATAESCHCSHVSHLSWAPLLQFQHQQPFKVLGLQTAMVIGLTESLVWQQGLTRSLQPHQLLLCYLQGSTTEEAPCKQQQEPIGGCQTLASAPAATYREPPQPAAQPGFSVKVSSIPIALKSSLLLPRSIAPNV